MLARWMLCLCLLIFGSLACTQKSTTEVTSAPAQKGKLVYQANCTACHNADPKLAGSVGPDVFGSSRELLEARILRAEYPPNYKPKRATHAMAALPHLKDQIDALTAYLNP